MSCNGSTTVAETAVDAHAVECARGLYVRVGDEERVGDEKGADRQEDRSKGALCFFGRKETSSRERSTKNFQPKRMTDNRICGHQEIRCKLKSMTIVSLNNFSICSIYCDPCNSFPSPSPVPLPLAEFRRSSVTPFRFAHQPAPFADSPTTDLTEPTRRHDLVREQGREAGGSVDTEGHAGRQRPQARSEQRPAASILRPSVAMH